jgi:hypothetical protein
MSKNSHKIDVYLEAGAKRTFAGAIDWPGWCRSGRDADAALQALIEFGPRYARIVAAKRLGFDAPDEVSALHVVERLAGNTTTDFGAPDLAPSSDRLPVDDAELKRFQKLLEAYWKAFDAAVQAAEGQQLRRGPRGGGRELAAIVEHVVGAEAGYLGRLAWKLPKTTSGDLGEKTSQVREAVLAALTAAAHGEVPTRGPRGGVIWTPRYFVRRVAWHGIDHLWEIEDRVEGGR